MMVKDCKLSPAEAIDASTWNPVCLPGHEKTLVSIQAGKIADLIAVSENPLENIEALCNINFVV